MKSMPINQETKNEWLLGKDDRVRERLELTVDRYALGEGRQTDRQIETH